MTKLIGLTTKYVTCVTLLTTQPDKTNSFKALYRKEIASSKVTANSKFISQSNNIQRASWQIFNKYKMNINTSTNDIGINSDELNKHFTDIAKKITDKLPITISSPDSLLPVNQLKTKFYFVPISEVIIRDILKSLKNSNTTGVDGLSVNVIKSVIDPIVTLLIKIVNSCIENSCFPDLMKTAKVIPIHKKGDVSDVNNYGPISILPVFSKILEKVLYNQIVLHFINNNLFFDSQFGFRSHKNTTDAVLDYLKYVTEALAAGEYSLGTFLDLSKAFDCISHNILFKKLQFYGFDDKSYKMLKSYLLHRKQYTQVYDNKSDCLSVLLGIPQGSILGPLLFLIYINDFPAFMNSKTILYTDDTTLLSRDSKLPTLLAKNTSGIDKAKIWFNSNKLCLNSDKTQTLLLTNKKRDLRNPLFIKFLGINIDSHLRWDHHVDALSQKLRKTVFLIRSLKREVEKGVLLKVYFSLSSPISTTV